MSNCCIHLPSPEHTGTSVQGADQQVDTWETNMYIRSSTIFARGGGISKEVSTRIILKSYWALSKQRTEKRLQIPTVGSIPACPILQAGTRQSLAGSLWVRLSKANLLSCLEWHVRKLVVYIHVRRSGCLSCLCVILHLELRLRIQFHKTNSGSFREEWVGSPCICHAPAPFLMLAQAFMWRCCQFLTRPDLGDRINVCAGMRNGTETIGGEPGPHLSVLPQIKMAR